VSERRPAPFAIKDSALVTLSVGRSAHNLRELRDGISEAPAASIRHHFLEALLRPSFDDPEFRNDFAVWAREALRDVVLAERLAIVDPIELPDAEAIRAELVDIVEDRLDELTHPPAAPPGHDFDFLRSQVVVFDTGQTAEEPADLARLAPGLSTGSVYFHFVDARVRPPRGEDDFSAWLAGWGEAGRHAREHLATIDPMFGSLVELRARVAEALDEAFGSAA